MRFTKPQLITMLDGGDVEPGLSRSEIADEANGSYWWSIEKLYDDSGSLVEDRWELTVAYRAHPPSRRVQAVAMVVQRGDAPQIDTSTIRQATLRPEDTKP